MMLRRLVSKALRRPSWPDSVDFGAFQLAFDPRDGGGRQYLDAAYDAELISPLERELVERFRPDLFVDIGANYGFTALVHHTLNPSSRIIAVEPSPAVAGHLRRNLAANGCGSAVVIEAVCSDHDGHSTFALNPASSQDNRVIGQPGWRTVQQPATSLTTVLKSAAPAQFVYMKVDTQGHEERVLRGGLPFLDAASHWIMKMEFAPKWLRTQGTDPVEFLAWLTVRYHVIEVPRRIRFLGDSLARLADHRLEPPAAAEFVNYIERLARGEGWCDLLIAPSTLELR